MTLVVIGIVIIVTIFMITLFSYHLFELYIHFNKNPEYTENKREY